MCGPTLVLRRERKAGDLVYCPSCRGEYAVEADAGQLRTVATGHLGGPRELEPEADIALIAGVVRESARALLA